MGHLFPVMMYRQLGIHSDHMHHYDNFLHLRAHTRCSGRLVSILILSTSLSESCTCLLVQTIGRDEELD